jgi:acyl-CoA synthetase (NDP forming)
VQIVRGFNEKKTKPMLVLSVGGEYAQKMNSMLERSRINVFDNPVEIALALKKLYEFCRKF